MQSSRKSLDNKISHPTKYPVLTLVKWNLDASKDTANIVFNKLSDSWY